MKTVIGGIEVEYVEAGAPVKISGEGSLEGLALFELYSTLRSIYNQQNSTNGRNKETKVLRKIKLPPRKSDTRL